MFLKFRAFSLHFVFVSCQFDRSNLRLIVDRLMIATFCAVMSGLGCGSPD